MASTSDEEDFADQDVIRVRSAQTRLAMGGVAYGGAPLNLAYQQRHQQQLLQQAQLGHLGACVAPPFPHAVAFAMLPHAMAMQQAVYVQAQHSAGAAAASQGPSDAATTTGSSLAYNGDQTSSGSRKSTTTQGLHGRIKLFNREKQFGFIECQYLQDEGLGDAFLSATGLAQFSVGDTVIFSIQFNERGQPQAVNGSLVSVENLIGNIKRFNERTGFGFISCNALKDQGLNDVFLLKTELGTFNVGDTIRFSVRFNNKGQPQAHDLRALVPARATESIARASTTASEAAVAAAPQAQVGNESDIPPATATDIESMTSVPASIPTSDAAQWLNSGAATASSSSSSAAAAAAAPPNSAPREAMKDLQGRIKSFSAKNSWGFIESDALKELQLGDAYLREAELGDALVRQKQLIGTCVLFTAAFNARGQPQAIDVRPSIDEDGDQELFHGKIKSFNSAKGYGFIDCPLLKQHGLSDVFLLKDEIGTFGIGDFVNFAMTYNDKGQPQARQLRAAAPDEQVFNQEVRQRQQRSQFFSQRHLCIVCQEAEIGIMYEECRHGCLCRDCSAKADARGDNSLACCPVCRKAGPRIQLFLA
jgi:cold shock CspA family protein